MHEPSSAGSASPAFIVRAADVADLDRLLEIHVAAFPDPRPSEVRRRTFLYNRLGGFEHLRVVEHAGDVIAHAFSFPITGWFGGRAVQGSAIASVGVAPESRGRGVASALLAALHDEAATRGDAFTILYPFRQGFYSRLGYGPVARYRVHELSPRAIPAAWRGAGRGIVRRAEPHDRRELARVYLEAAQRGTGFIERQGSAWQHDLLDERRHWLVIDHAGSLDGYTSFTLHQSEPHARVRAQVHEVLARDDSARRQLLGALGSLGDQIADLTIALADDDPLDLAFIDGDRNRAGTAEVEHPVGVVGTGPMIRLIHARAALLARGYTSDGAVNLAIDGERAFGLDVERGVARVASAQGRVTLHTTSNALGSVAFGGIGLGPACRLGWIGPTDADALRSASRLLRLGPFFSLDVF